MAPLNKGPFPWQPGQVLGSGEWGGGGLGGPQGVGVGSCRPELSPCTYPAELWRTLTLGDEACQTPIPGTLINFSFEATHAVKKRLMKVCHVLYSTLNGANLIIFFQKLIFCFQGVKIFKKNILNDEYMG